MKKSITETRIGIIGGGQLGRMIIQSAIDFNLDISILDPDPNAPCKNLTSNFVVGSLTDFDAVYNFGRDLDLITIEIENVNTEALRKLESEGKTVYPQPEIIELIQNKIDQKCFYRDNHIPTAKFHVVENRLDVEGYIDELPLVNKLGTGGYDGRGVQILRTESDLSQAFDSPGIVEDLIPFEKEISVITSRSQSGKISTFPTVELVFHPTQNLVEFLFAPARISDHLQVKARKIAEDIILKLDMVGLLAVEMFLTKSGEILVNEIAPRPHNSGHQSIEGNITSQFEQHLRSILDLPPGDTSIKSKSAMINLLGEDGYTGHAIYEGLEEVMEIDAVHVHMYGKLMTKPFRKMGHVTVLADDFDLLEEKARFVKQKLKVKA